MLALILLLPLSLATATGSQKALGGQEVPSFIQSTIYRKHDVDLQSLPDTVSIPPTYDMRDVAGAPYTSGQGTFGRIDYEDCFAPSASDTFDIAIVGHPFDLGVSYRPGARFGPNGARQGARRISAAGGRRMESQDINPFREWATVVDCGDIANTPFDKEVALWELEKGMSVIGSQKPKNSSVADVVRAISIGGDHTITLPILRALHSTWGPVAVLHFDSHLDTWDPTQRGGGVSKHAGINHGTMLHIAHEEGLMSNASNMHLGSRCSIYDEHYDLDNDHKCGFSYILARELDTLGPEKVIQKIVDTVKDEYVYISVDIDVLDPAFAPATGTIEPGGWTTRELMHIIRGLADAGLKIVGGDVVEFTPIYDNAAETTGIAVGQIVVEILKWMVRVPVNSPKISNA
ncbi:putative agmatinase [Coleophoma cylindrospora]|uniref:Putative agmatinase n=1 Tax=Coleophoma cylindrospora TaxID=1849047 RepID=A0A3D8RBX8_9HELO|nr:putative agmatinase [Coleophoma cylindrospora]